MTAALTLPAHFEVLDFATGETQVVSSPMELLQLTPEQTLHYIAGTLIQGGDPTPEQLAYFLWRCRQTGMDPFGGLVVGILRKDKNSPFPNGQTLCFQTTYEGFNSIADASGLLVDVSEPEYDREPDDKPPKWCKVSVTKIDARSGREVTRRFTALFGEWSTGTDFWRDRPWHMLALRAEARALKKAFPQATSGFSVAFPGGERMDEQGMPARASLPEQAPKRLPRPRASVSAAALERATRKVSTPAEREADAAEAAAG